MELLKVLQRALNDLDYAPEFDGKRNLEDLLRKAVKLAKVKQESLDEAKSLTSRIEKLHKRLYSGGYKPKSKLVDKKKTKIPGFSYYFKKD